MNMEKDAIQKYWEEKQKQAEYWRDMFIKYPKALEEYAKSKLPAGDLLQIELDKKSVKGTAQFIFKSKGQGIFPFWFYESDIWMILRHFDKIGIYICCPLISDENGTFTVSVIKKKQKGVLNMAYFLNKNGEWQQLIMDNNRKEFTERIEAMAEGVKMAFGIREKQLF